MSDYKEQIEKQAGVIGNIGKGMFYGQAATGAALGSVMGGIIGYDMARGDSFPAKMDNVNSYRKDKANGFKDSLKGLSTNEHIVYGTPMSNSNVVEYEDGWTDALIDDVAGYAKANNIDIDKMKVSDYRNLVDDIGAIQYYDGSKIDNKMSRQELRLKGLNSMKNGGHISDDDFNAHNIYKDKLEKKAFLTEMMIGGAVAGAGAYGAGKVVNGVQNVFGPKTKKARKEYNEFMNDKNNKSSYDAWRNEYGFSQKEIENMIKENPNITVGELRNQVSQRYSDALNNVSKTAFDIVDGSFDKMAMIGVGAQISESDTGRFGLSVGIPFGVSADAYIGNGQLRPKVGIGLLGPTIGLSYRSEKSKLISDRVIEYKKSKDYKEHTKEERKSFIDDIKNGRIDYRDPNEMFNNMTNSEIESMRNEFKEKLKNKYGEDEANTMINNFLQQSKTAFDIVDDSFDKIAESTYGQDLMAGIDPTGVRTFRNALDNEKNHGKHKAMGNIGGFLGGAVGGALMPAALTGAASLATKKKMPGLSHNLGNMAKGSLDAFNPKKVMKYTKSLGKLSEFQGLGSKLMSESNKAMAGLDKADKLKAIMNSGKKLSPAQMHAVNSNTRGSVNAAKNLRGINNKVQELGADLSKNYYGGKSVSEGGERALTALTTLGTAAAGGALNASSAHMQYNTARNTRKMLDEQIEGSKTAFDIVDSSFEKIAMFKKTLGQVESKMNNGDSMAFSNKGNKFYATNTVTGKRNRLNMKDQHTSNVIGNMQQSNGMTK